MKTLIFTLILSTTAFAVNPDEFRLSDNDINQKLISVARDVKNEDILKNATELRSCREDFQKVPNRTDPNAIRVLESCIQTKVGTGAAAAALAEKLELETFKLIPSKTIKNVTGYLSKKLYLELTGVDIDENDPVKQIASQKFGTKKLVDHKTFFELYKNQIAKNVLYEVSRFCFVDLRRATAPNDASGAPAKTFTEHWNNLSDFDNRIDVTQTPNAVPVKDDGKPKFEDTGATIATDAPSSYSNIMRNTFNGGTAAEIPSTQRLENFFFFCGAQIQKLCKDYEDKCHDSSTGRRKRECGGSNTVGANACLAKTRLTAFRSAMKSSDLIMEEFKKDNGTDISILLDPNQIVKRYQGGSGPGNEKSLNELTNTASADFFRANETDNSDTEAQDCVTSGGDDCEKFEIIDDSVARIQTNTDIVYEAKRAAEIERVKELVKMGGQSLETYIDQNYPDLKDMVKANNGAALEKAISAKWDARREALQKDIQDRIGARQIKEETTDPTFQDERKRVAVNNAKEVLSERTRLAQVVFFNNIISSSLELKDSNQKSLGRNVQALNNELAAAENDIQPDVFNNLKGLGTTTSGSSGGSSGGQLSGNESVTNIDFLDDFIGVPKTP